MKLENIDKSIQKQDILKGISLEVSPQKLTAFIGPLILRIPCSFLVSLLMMERRVDFPAPLGPMKAVSF